MLTNLASLMTWLHFVMPQGNIRRGTSRRLRARYRQWRWHRDEMYVKINGEMHYLWRAVDPEGEVLESFAAKTRDKAAALKFMKRAMKRYGNPEAIAIAALTRDKLPLD